MFIFFLYIYIHIYIICCWCLSLLFPPQELNRLILVFGFSCRVIVKRISREREKGKSKQQQYLAFRSHFCSSSKALEHPTRVCLEIWLAVALAPTPTSSQLKNVRRSHRRHHRHQTSVDLWWTVTRTRRTRITRESIATARVQSLTAKKMKRQPKPPQRPPSRDTNGCSSAASSFTTQPLV